MSGRNRKREPEQRAPDVAAEYPLSFLTPNEREWLERYRRGERPPPRGGVSARRRKRDGDA